MGIPQFFGWLSRKYDSQIIFESVEGIDHFYFDFNCLIYHCYAKLDYQKLLPKTIPQRQAELIEEVLKYTQKIIFSIKPKKSVGICIDGVVPMAKMHQQRLRRYKTPIFREWENDIKKKYGVFQEELLDTNQITPGTPFMNDLAEALRMAIKNKFFGNINVVLSPANSPGEGEHKIMNMIRVGKIPREERICIYGLDADLIMLSLTLSENRLWLIRENVHIGKSDRSGEFLYVSIENLSNIIFLEVKNVMTDKKIDVSKLIKSRIINDYVFLGFLLGNDFLHTIPSLSIFNNGVDYVLNLYANCYRNNKNYLLSIINTKTRVNNGFLKNIFESLGSSEVDSLKFLASKKKPPAQPNFDDHYSEERWKWDRVPYNPLFEKCFSVIDYRNAGWRKKYYQLYFDINVDDENDLFCLNNICKNYFDGIMFVVRYYFDGDISWYWYNPYPVCPFASDLSNYLKGVSDLNLIKLEKGDPFTPFEQLMMVLPKKSRTLLPSCLAEEMIGSRLERFYPDEFEWIAWEKVMLYSIEPKLPELDISLMRQVVDSVRERFTEVERLRNLVI